MTLTLTLTLITNSTISSVMQKVGHFGLATLVIVEPLKGSENRNKGQLET